MTNGSVDGSGTGSRHSIGGLAGVNNGSIQNSNANGSVDGSGTGSRHSIGGWQGGNNGSIQNSYATGNLSGGGTGSRHSMGGLVGRNANSVRNSYATGNLSGGGTGSHHTIGGLIAVNNSEGTVLYSYHSSVNNSIGTAKTALQSWQLTATQTQTDFGTAGRWSTDVWDFGTNAQYPALKSTNGQSYLWTTVTPQAV